MARQLRLNLPMSRDVAEDLQLGDMVSLDGPIVFTAGLPTHRRILDGIRSDKPPPIDLTRAAFFHLGSYIGGTADGPRILYMNPTTSTRFNAMMPEIIRHFELRCVGGKGGLDDACAAALGEVGGVYLSFLGGGATLITAAIEEVLAIAWDDLISHYRLVSVAVSGLGPLTVAIDARGNNLYSQLSERARNRRGEILDQLARRRGEPRSEG